MGFEKAHVPYAARQSSHICDLFDLGTPSYLEICALEKTGIIHSIQETGVTVGVVLAALKMCQTALIVCSTALIVGIEAALMV